MSDKDNSNAHGDKMKATTKKNNNAATSVSAASAAADLNKQTSKQNAISPPPPTVSMKVVILLFLLSTHCAAIFNMWHGCKTKITCNMLNHAVSKITAHENCVLLRISPNLKHSYTVSLSDAS